MGQVVFFALCLLGCFVFGLSDTPGEDAGDEDVAARYYCPPGAIYIRGNCYEFFRNSISWDLAEAQCQNLRHRSHLASFSSMREEKLVSAYIKRFSTTNYVWIGLNAMPNVNKLMWEWSDRSPYISGSPLWDNRSPSTTISSSECLLLTNVQSPSSSTRWMQQSCYSSYPYVCKYTAFN
ncbi:PREDICTED: dromaiocalcin-1-like [Gekko japonicus]|uniref:Dromaiocalcin-1-like n=1 Tax=Gekko japonicus TaxID=146911 RepID=A0ABM1K415_GEKJA|nr:PREDICTED: dromaiocalcin-1-like [Gekko japonicus]